MGPLDRAREDVTGIVSLLVLGAGLVALFAGVEVFWVVWVVGFAVVVPIVAILAGEDDDRDGQQTPGGTRADETTAADVDTEAALATLRERYARGDLSEAQFERKLERLLETETPEAARERIDRAATRTDPADAAAGGDEATPGREREPDRR
jgi:uncharacterized membrane protein